MAATRLSDAQKQEIVARYQDGVSSADLAELYACSANTVSRVVKAALSPEAYAALKQQRARASRPAAPAAAPVAAEAIPEVSGSAEASLSCEPSPVEPPHPGKHPISRKDDPDPAGPAAAEPAGDSDGPGVLPIDDADDFAADADVDADADGMEDAEAAGDEVDDDEDEAGVATPAAAAGQEPVQCRCLSEARLPESAYLLVDKTVELQPTPLSECTELGLLPQGEAERQALLVYANQRQAKRHCGRSQRVIPLPDAALLRRTAPYLLARGISRIVIDGSLYSLPGSS